jgi:hypothetical protein
MEETFLSPLRLRGAPRVGLEATRRGVGVLGVYEDDERVIGASSHENPCMLPVDKRKSVGVTNEATESVDDLFVSKGVTGVPHSEDIDGR